MGNVNVRVVLDGKISITYIDRHSAFSNKIVLRFYETRQCRSYWRKIKVAPVAGFPVHYNKLQGIVGFSP